MPERQWEVTGAGLTSGMAIRDGSSMQMLEKIGELLTFLGLYAGIPLLLIWGWIRWAIRPASRTVCSALSLLGFVLATASALLAASSIVYAHAIGGFPFYDPRLLRIFRCGAALSLLAILFGIAGIWRSSPLRWFSPICAMATLFFWFEAAMAE